MSVKCQISFLCQNPLCHNYKLKRNEEKEYIYWRNIIGQNPTSARNVMQNFIVANGVKMMIIRKTYFIDQD